MVRSILFALVLVFALTVSALAQEVPALPPPSTIGDGWTLVATAPPNPNMSDAFSAAAFGIYGGPAGSRAVVSVFRVAEGATAIRTSWEIANADLETYRLWLHYGIDYNSQRALSSVNPPNGCSDVQRLEGVDELGWGEIPLGITLCAADDPPLIVLVIASGEVNGLGGHEASDAIVEAVLAAQTLATPTP